MADLVITAAKRTPIGGFLGSLKDVSAVQLGVTALKAILPQLAPEDIRDVIVGNVLQAGCGMNPARQIALGAGLPYSVPGQTVSRVCGSGLQALVTALQAIKAGDGELYIAGGTESMSNAPYLASQARSGCRFGNSQLLDSIMSDGLTDPTHGYSMGITAENIAEQWNISRYDQDAFALESQQRAAASIRDGSFVEEVVPVEIPSRKHVVSVRIDEHPRPDSSREGLARLKPVFKPDNGTVTAGNSSGLNDGAAMMAVATEGYARNKGLPVLARILSYGVAGVDPRIMGIGPVAAVTLALTKACLSIDEIDLFEINEAFAAQSLAVIRLLGIDPKKVNICGGAIALGHPIGASGARVVVTLLQALRRLGKKLGVASLCIGGGMGIAIVLSTEQTDQYEHAES